MTSSPIEDPDLDLEPFTPEVPFAPPPSAVDAPDQSHFTPPFDDEKSQPGVLVLSAAVLFGIIWSIGSGLMLSLWYGGEALFNSGPERLFGFLFVTVGPGLLIACLGFLGRELSRFTTKARELEIVAAKLAAPVAGAKGDARRMSDAIASEVSRIGDAADGALSRLGAMEEVLRHHAEAVNDAAGSARGQVDAMIEDLRAERTSVTEMVDTLAEEAKRITETIERQAEMVSAAADLAGAHATESRQLLEKAAERLAAAGGGAQQSGEKAAFAISEQMRDMDALVTALDERATRLENVAKSQESNLKLAQKTAHELGLASEAGSGAMREAVNAAVEHARRLSDLLAEESRALSKKTADDIEHIRATADAARLASEDAGRALETTAATVAAHMDTIKEAGRMSASSDDAFQARMRDMEGVMSKVENRVSQAVTRMNTALSEQSRSAPSRPAARSDTRSDTRSNDRPDPRASARDIDPFNDLDADPAPPRYRDEDRDHFARGRDRGRDVPRDDRRNDRDERRDDRRDDRRDNGRDRLSRREPPSRENGTRRQDPDLRRRHDERDHDADAEFLDDRSIRMQERRPTRPGDPGDGDAPSRGGYDTDPRRGGRDDDRPEDAPGLSATTRDDPRNGARDDQRGWRWKDLLRDAEGDAPGRGGSNGGRTAGGDEIISGLRRAGVDPNNALDPDMTARIARARRRAGSGEARALVIDSALEDVRRTATALASDPGLRARAEAFIDEQARLVRRAVDQNDARGLGALFDSDAGRAFLLIDAALSDG